MQDHHSQRPSDLDADFVECLILVVPDLNALAQVAEELAALVRASTVRVMDLACVTRSEDGRLEVRELEEVGSLEALLDVEGEVGGRFSTHDLMLASTALSPGSSALVLLVEDVWLEGVSRALRSAGGRALGGERLNVAPVGARAEADMAGPDTEVDDGASR